jgi:hypothetical protein
VRRETHTFIAAGMPRGPHRGSIITAEKERNNKSTGRRRSADMPEFWGQMAPRLLVVVAAAALERGQRRCSVIITNTAAAD